MNFFFLFLVNLTVSIRLSARGKRRGRTRRISSEDSFQVKLDEPIEVAARDIADHFPQLSTVRVNAEDILRDGNDMFRAGNYRKARAKYQLVIELQTNNGSDADIAVLERAAFNLGRSYHELGEYDKAIGMFTELTQNSNNSHLIARAFENIASARLMKHGDLLLAYENLWSAMTYPEAHLSDSDVIRIKDLFGKPIFNHFSVFKQ